MRTGRCYSLPQLGEYARKKRGGDTQAQASEKVGAKQPSISGAENGDSERFATLKLLIEHYSPFTLEGPYYKLARKE